MDENKNNLDTNTKLNYILAAGFLILLAGIGMSLNQFASDADTSVFRPVILFAIGELFLYAAFCHKKRALLIGLGFMFIFDGIFFSVLDLNFLPLGLKELWPILVISSGLCIIPADLFIYKRFRTIYLFPAILLITLGLVFLLFSTHIISVSFSAFISLFWPLVLIVIGIALIAIYAIQQNTAKKFPYMQDDSANEENLVDGFF